jgi:hypothetical protein
MSYFHYGLFHGPHWGSYFGHHIGPHHKARIWGTWGDDVLDGTNKNDIIFGFSGDDVIYAKDGNDWAFGGRGGDAIDGGKGNDKLFGGRGNDALIGGEGKDELSGGAGRDLLIGGAGNDRLEGGCGPDKFVIRPGTGTDKIVDMGTDDRIDLRDFNFASGDAVIAAFQQVGKNAVLDLGNGDKLIVEKFKIANFDAFQFIVSDAETGPSSSKTPYVIGVDPAISTTAILTVGDDAGLKSDGVTPWTMVGIPDGLGAYDNGDGTFTVLMNHELSSGQGAVRDHGGTGAFVSKLIIDKASLEVLSGSDLVKHVYLYNTTTDSYYDPVADGDPGTLAYSFNRLCSADLPELAAFYNAETGLGYNGRIFMNGEESGPTGKAFAHFVSGSEAGNSYELPWLGKFSWENAVANPFTGDKTIVAGTDDSSPGQLYFYFGDKQATGTALEKAGLVNGSLWGVKVAELDNVTNNNNESNATDLGADHESAFSLVNLGDVSETSGGTLQTLSETNGVTEFLRPEDGAWDTVSDDRFYFVTTNSFSSPSRLWAMDFNDPANPNAGGTIKLLLDGTEGQHMLDNMTVTKSGKVLLQEDVGNNAHSGKIWEYDPENDQIKILAEHDPNLFTSGSPDFLTADEEASGIIDVTDILGSAGQNAFLLDVQAHYNIAGELVQGGQLLAMYQDIF